jgi:hypothetical protein
MNALRDLAITICTLIVGASAGWCLAILFYSDQVCKQQLLLEHQPMIPESYTDPMISKRPL